MNHTKEILVRALALIDTPEKWIKERPKAIVNGQQCYCASHAISRARESYRKELLTTDQDAVLPEMVLPWRILADAIPRKIYQENIGIPGWNDAVERTHAEVVSIFEKAINAA